MSGFETTDARSERFINLKEDESVQFSDAIQPHGILMVLLEPELSIVSVSTNTQTYLGFLPQNLLGQRLEVLLVSQQIDRIRQQLQAFESASVFKLLFHESIAHSAFDARVYRSDRGIVLELEPFSPVEATAAFNLYSWVKGTIAQLRQQKGLSLFTQRVAQSIRQITGFDRVMLYQFDPQGSGAVIAEAKQDDLVSYLGLHYPATDIPQPVRTLYANGLLRYIPDLQAMPVELLAPEPNPGLPPLDLSRSRLRAVDPCCIEYHRNMGVAAILVMALVKDQQLWGLISCHHQTPKPVSFEMREALELVAQFISSELANQHNHEELDYVVRLRSLHSDFVASIAQATDLKAALGSPASRLLDLVSAQGAAICLGEEIMLVGKTPALEEVRALLSWTATQIKETLWHTHTLTQFYSAAAAYPAIASGLLVLQISKVQRYAILWFRPEVLQTVDWAGAPVATDQEGQAVLSPRKSFERWQEIVQFTALPWRACELENALDLHHAIVGIVLHKADELARINRDLERSNQELDSFTYVASHDLKEPLRGIHNYSKLLLKSYANVLDEMGTARLHTLVRLTRRMESLIDVLLKFSRLGQTELCLQPTDLDPVVHQTLEDLHVSYQDTQLQIRLPRSLPTVYCDPVLINEVFTNLLSNALKYNDKPERWIEIGFTNASDQLQDREESCPIAASPHSQDANLYPTIVLYVRDNGIGIRERHRETVFRLFKRLHEQNLYGGGTGAGLTIAKKIVERHGGKIWVESTYGEGSTFCFTLQTWVGTQDTSSPPHPKDASR
ncbi:MAG: GAF domain-containing protein [Scytolyngbya sp. HA4215-MV1]|jgi:light-regulated signal transduction histidine kinase (bacteriophytochrome)|nr:GAF domain-containing protein [Scytolyngbya sp. HA4215-MV1]